MKLDVLVFAAHPDDAELCCGGIIRKFVKKGKRTGIVDLTAGELSTRGNVSIRQKEVQKASKILDISSRDNLMIEDGNIQNTPQNRSKVISIIRKYRPELLLIPHESDRHPDHGNTNRLVRDAAFKSGLAKVRTTSDGRAQKPHRAGKNIFYMQTYTFEPTFIVDISNEFDDKMKAIKAYATQFHNASSKGTQTFISTKRFLEYIVARARFYGFQIGCEYGEAFYTEEKVKLDINNLL